MCKIRRIAAAFMMAGAVLGASTAPSLAECTGQPNRFPHYAEVAPTARTVVIGTVVGSQSEDPTEATVLFSLRVDDVLRGHPPVTMDIKGLRSGLPVRGAEGCRENAFLYVHVGDVIALALDGRLDGRTGISTAAWIEGRPDRLLMPAGQVLSRARAIAAAKALPGTDTLPHRGAGLGDAAADLVAIVLRALAAAWHDVFGSEAP